MKIVNFKFTNMEKSGILMHNPQSMKRTSGAKFDTKKIPSPEEEAAAARYLTDDGKFMRFPLQGFKASLVSGGVGRRIGKRAASSVLKGTIFPAEEWVTLLDVKTNKPIKADEYTIDSRRVVVQGNAILRSRPEVKPWCCIAPFELDDIIDDPKLLVEIGNLAGRTVGVGDYRPETGGWFGRYTVKLAD